MDALRSFLSGRRLAFIGILLAIPFVFFGSSSFGTVFTNYGKEIVDIPDYFEGDILLGSKKMKQADVTILESKK